MSTPSMPRRARSRWRLDGPLPAPAIAKENYPGPGKGECGHGAVLNLWHEKREEAGYQDGEAVHGEECSEDHVHTEECQHHPQNGTLPDQEALKRTRGHGDIENLELNESDQTVF